MARASVVRTGAANRSPTPTISIRRTSPPAFGMTYLNWDPGMEFPTPIRSLERCERARYDESDTLENALLQAEAGGQAIDRTARHCRHQFCGRLARAVVGAEGQKRNLKGSSPTKRGAPCSPGAGARTQAGRALRSQLGSAGRVHEAHEFRSRRCFATTSTRVRSGPPQSTWRRPSAASSTVTAAIARILLLPDEVRAATRTSPLPISIRSRC